MTSALDRLFGLFDLLALAAIVVAALGIVNTLSMDVWERVRELGVLRAAGMSRRQVWRMMLVEAGILGLIGAVVGSVAGLGVGWILVVTAGGRFDVPLTAPWASIGLAFVLGIGSRWSPHRSPPASPAACRSSGPSAPSSVATSARGSTTPPRRLSNRGSSRADGGC